jgi:Divergent InlB B-repeat domain
MNRTKNCKVVALILLSSLLVLAALNVSVLSVQAQSQATVTIISSLGGTTDPAEGTTSYTGGTAVTLTATPVDGFLFDNWQIATPSGTTTTADNPATITVEAGVDYAAQAIFVPIENPPAGVPVTDYTTAAIVVVLPAIGGTTSPPPATYALADASELMLTATAASGWQFSHWVIGGSPMDHGAYSFTATPTDNPYNVNHGYGNTYTYQPVFTPIGTTEPTPIPELSTIIVALALVAAAAGTIAYKRKTK